MNRRDYLRSLAIGSVGLSVSPFETLANGKKNEVTAHAATIASTTGLEGVLASTGTQTLLVADAAVIQLLKPYLPDSFTPLARQTLQEQDLLERLARGNALVWLGNARDLPPALSVGAYTLGREPVAVKLKADSPIKWDNAALSASTAMGAYIAPPKGMPYHNVDEEIRRISCRYWKQETGLAMLWVIRRFT